MSDRDLGEEDVGLSEDTIRSNDEGNVSPKQRSGFIQAFIDAIVGAAVAVVIPVRASIDKGSKIPVQVDKRRSVVIPVNAILDALGLCVIIPIFRPAGGRGIGGGIASIVFVRKP